MSPAMRRHALMPAFTLIESALCITIVGLMLAAAFNVTASAARARRSIGEQRMADALLRAMLSEVASRQYGEPGSTTLGLDSGESQSSRLGLDDVDDYNGLTEQPPTWIDGTRIDSADKWQRSTAVAFVAFNGTTRTISSSGSDTGLKRITVTVTSPRGVRSSASAFRSVRGYADTDYSNTGVVRWTRVSITPAGGRPVSAQTTLLNTPTP